MPIEAWLLIVSILASIIGTLSMAIYWDVRARVVKSEGKINVILAVCFHILSRNDPENTVLIQEVLKAIKGTP
jgi:hypothetical protein